MMRQLDNFIVCLMGIYDHCTPAGQNERSLQINLSLCPIHIILNEQWNFQLL